MILILLQVGNSARSELREDICPPQQYFWIMAGGGTQGMPQAVHTLALPLFMTLDVYTQSALRINKQTWMERITSIPIISLFMSR